ncbi:glycosyltransferase [Ohtaekwangia koreensis]|uniref:Glycosyltransferase involved in cell wall bisynthesis n=1 Tax=Ohtaekwangia koreensis TaxID=688867 RepID=A0A1T5M2S6_9BACT|nr:glycosyltransferase [Ohtaekwangia koreensis]SKC82496.1 Glycosyltransferase involved in cell wall bisynthesis [Ohtaekwangia koreensis]
MNKGVDIVMLALARWDGPYASTAFSLAKELSKNNRVFYIDNPFTMKDVFSNLDKAQIQSRLTPLFTGQSIGKQIYPDNPNLINVRTKAVIPINFIPYGKLYNSLSRVNNHVVNQALRSIIKRYNISRFIFINSFNPFYLQDVTEFNPALTVYHCVDNIAESKYIGKHGKILEAGAMRDYDVTITTSKKLCEMALRYTQNVHCLPNAADFTHFQKAVYEPLLRPTELKGLESKKIIGYIGHVDFRIDYELLNTLSRTHADKIILMVGPEHVADKDKLERLPNVISTGKKSFDDLPAYLKYMDCAIIPFLRNDLTASIYPLKLNEYLAAGKPIVTTGFSPDLEDFGNTIRIENTIDGFVKGVEQEINTDSIGKREQRMQMASHNTWSSRVENFWQIVSPLIENKKVYG